MFLCLTIVCIVLYYIVIYTRVFFFCKYEYNFRLHRCILYCCMLFRYFYLITLNRWTPRPILLLLKQDRPWVCDDDQIHAYKDQSTIRFALIKEMFILINVYIVLISYTLRCSTSLWTRWACCTYVQLYTGEFYWNTL